eukprot:TRINITY_DN2964_c0_g1_i2.p1 TRINITY_DN2964_c0_g1~~TRINITY_DN2964_c0_g1_i2.p1  ORF type:complete len:346 (-),score=63.78 TRINITY_DN2964_c0_g1_i2:298-1335(-)
MDPTDLKNVIRIQAMVRTVTAAKHMKKKVHRHVFRTKIAHELKSTEQSFVSDLITCIEEYETPLRALIKKEKLDVIFSNISELIKVHKTLAAEFEQRISKNEWNYHASIGDVILPVIDQFAVYETYINNYNQATIMLKDQRENSVVSKLLDSKVSEVKRVRGLSLESYLIMPIQRLPRILLLIRELIKYTPKSHVDAIHLEAAYAKLTALTQALNYSKKLNENVHKTLALEKEISGLQLGFLTAHQFTHEGALEVLKEKKAGVLDRTVKKDSSAKSIVQKKTVYVFLFNNFLLYAKKLSASQKAIAKLGPGKAVYKFSSPTVIKLLATDKAVATQSTCMFFFHYY